MFQNFLDFITAHIALSRFHGYVRAMKTAFAALLAGLLAVSCAPSTPQSRIEAQPAKFAALSRKDKALVEQGKIDRGMSQDAVWLAWGAPSRVLENSKDGKPGERWDYTRTEPVYTTSAFAPYGYGWGGPRGYYPYYGFAVFPEVAYVPYRSASVWFVRDRVDSWERVK